MSGFLSSIRRPCVCCRERVYISSRVCRKLPESLSLLQLPTHPPISLDFFSYPENWIWSSWPAPTSAFTENDSWSSCEHYIQFRWMGFANSKQLNTPHYPVLISLPFLPARCFIGVLSSWEWHIPTKGLRIQIYFCFSDAVTLVNAWLYHPETPTSSKCAFGSHCLQLVPNCSWC